MLQIADIKKLSPVKIYYKNDIYQYDFTNKIITIDNTKDDNETIMSLLHEIGHAIHDANGCKCMLNLNDHTLSEYHAYKFAMKHIKDSKKLISIFISDILDELQRVYSNAHRNAAKRIIKLKQWQQFCKLEFTT